MLDFFVLTTNRIFNKIFHCSTISCVQINCRSTHWWEWMRPKSIMWKSFEIVWQRWIAIMMKKFNFRVFDEKSNFSWKTIHFACYWNFSFLLGLAGVNFSAAVRFQLNRSTVSFIAFNIPHVEYFTLIEQTCDGKSLTVFWKSIAFERFYNMIDWIELSNWTVAGEYGMCFVKSNQRQIEIERITQAIIFFFQLALKCGIIYISVVRSDR